MNQPEISILIPVYNVEKYLRECLDHALGQTLQNIEVVCVNDCSTDGSLAILHEYAKKDSRLKIIDLPENKGLYNVRRVGIHYATGEYSLFCDSDDFLDRNACQKLLTAITKEKSDAVMFSFAAFGCSQRETDLFTERSKCFPETGKSGFYYLLKVVQNKRNYICGWMYKTESLRQAYDLLPEERINYFEDGLALPLILAHCKKVTMYPAPLYHYRREGQGMTSSMTYQARLEKTFSFIQIENILSDVLQKNPKLMPDEVKKEFWFCRQRDVHTMCMDFIFTGGCSIAEAGTLLKFYFDKVEHAIATKYLILRYERYKYNVRTLQIIEASGILSKVNFCSQKIKTIAISYERFTVGGIERYMQHVINLFIQMGMKVVLLTTERNPEHDLALPAGVIHYELGRDVMTRIDRLSEIIEKEKIDLYYEQNFSAVSDLMVCKLRYNLPVIAHWHTAFSYYMRNGSDYGWSLCLQHRFYDLTLCLSDIAAMFFRTNGVKAKYLMNIQGFTADSVPTHPGNRPLKTILWLARLDAEVKQPRAAVQIMQEVVKTIPDAKMLIVGGPTPWNPNEPELLAKMIREAGLENNVTLCGEQLDVESYYRKADVFLMTSTVEGLGNTIYEASAHGLPVVMYDLPYLAYHSYPENGIVSVPMNDKNAAAEAICRILQNEDEHRELSARSRKMAEDISAIDFEQEWRKIFAALERGGEEFLHIGEEHQGALRVMMETLREHTLLGVNTKFRNLNDEIAHLKKNQASWLVRKFRGGIQCLKDNGFRYTVKRFFEKVKGKLSRRKGAV